MKWLLYYELRKTRQSKIVLAGVTGTLEIIFLLALLVRDTVALPMSGFLLFLAGIGGTMYMALESVIVLNRDLRTEQGYMVFMTPNNCWTILGAKTLQNLISLAVAGAVFVGLIYLDMSLAIHRFSAVKGFWYSGDLLLQSGVDSSLSYSDGTLLICAYVAYVTNWLSLTTMACLSVAIAASVLPGKRRSGILAFGVFVTLAFLSLWLQTMLPALPHYQTSLLLASAVAVGETVVMYTAGALLMERRLSV